MFSLSGLQRKKGRFQRVSLLSELNFFILFDGVFKYVFGNFFVNWILNLHILFVVDDDDGDNVQISGPVVFEQYVVTADYQKKNKNDISLTAGDLVDVIERNDYGKLFISGNFSKAKRL